MFIRTFHKMNTDIIVFNLKFLKTQEKKTIRKLIAFQEIDASQRDERDDETG